jgi:lysophospholipase L1-like esterase
MANGFERPPRWAWVVMIVGLVALAVLTPIALQRGKVSDAELAAAESEAAASASASTSAPGTPAAPADQPVAVFLGDSYTVGENSTEERGYAPLVAEAMGWRLVELGQSGTGYTTAGGAPGYEVFLDRVPEVVAEDPQFVVVQGGTNDLGVDADQMEQRAGEVLAALKTQLPQAAIFVVGPADPPQRDDDQMADVAEGLRTASAAANVTFIDPITEQWLTPDLFTDGLHPGDEGYRVFATRLVFDMQTALAASAPPG